ncbi:MAG: hypothetical protein J6Q57_03535, partial [Paraprevotella sp.]|nr:hypothetical protein [Paraprevotella sp.]
MVADRTIFIGVFSQGYCGVEHVLFFRVKMFALKSVVGKTKNASVNGQMRFALQDGLEPTTP